MTYEEITFFGKTTNEVFGNSEDRNVLEDNYSKLLIETKNNIEDQSFLNQLYDIAKYKPAKDFYNKNPKKNYEQAAEMVIRKKFNQSCSAAFANNRKLHAKLKRNVPRNLAEISTKDMSKTVKTRSSLNQNNKGESSKKNTSINDLKVNTLNTLATAKNINEQIHYFTPTQNQENEKNRTTTTKSVEEISPTAKFGVTKSTQAETLNMCSVGTQTIYCSTETQTTLSLLEKSKSMSTIATQTTICSTGTQTILNYKHPKTRIRNKICSTEKLDTNSKKGKKTLVSDIPKSRIRTCEICKRTYLSRGGLSRHMRSHDEKQFKYSCHICETSFYRKDQADEHRRAHCK